ARNLRAQVPAGYLTSFRTVVGRWCKPRIRHALSLEAGESFDERNRRWTGRRWREKLARPTIIDGDALSARSVQMQPGGQRPADEASGPVTCKFQVHG
ncbi:hypothetical protein K0M31_004030, partial [Melipona bicolor]